MNSVLRAIGIYVVLLLLFRLSGKRSLAQITTFDFVLVLIVGEATQQALLGEDFSITNAFLVILTLVGLDTAMSFWKQRSPLVEKWLDGVPIIIVVEGKLLQDRMKQAQVDADDILAAARELHGLERLDQIKYAVLERSGGISIIPKS
uniref:DUF421 domain-containing protein n=1 Tax=Trichocoleus desertorum TaxID=1481672 RepID=UPI0025B4D240|nr:YetF domain-containing protein [Trichocoleus desertorum]